MKLNKSNSLLFFRPYGDNGYLSNWYLSDFKVENKLFHSGEQWFMYAKAVLFGDTEIADMILKVPLYKESDNKKVKDLGRQVSNFNDEIWNTHKEELIYKGLLEKFKQNKDLRDKLLSTGNKILAEASPYDRVWGIGCGIDDSKAWDTDTWKGESILGKVLMRIRDDIRN